ncbi:deoxyguanosine kinase [Dictyostelium discoideum AX4]|uniref:Deoxyguanosine kinase n=1 Tax=Dictyostelium discoideum TaxID=44689 RepID=DGK_DICDI|nr:deoxyguanosine kinase [Dictyostelium discoideum AX4]Q54UT2.2 RecName: Full=Deoxyguanosine kinase; Short=dGK; AltName: Full=DddGK [Dictyostelium discoideum]AAV85947.1 deoxyguanosine kinase [Dictyostelium discoideum]EAL67033.2 deoxyguanosine kinase [Dictyostelium discoideum AX4]|eukprot:XP_641009.2 deoxyguanosine kinase [Dictyostelium discoideum AX4]
MFRRSLMFMISNNKNTNMVSSINTTNKVNNFSKIIILEGNISAGKTYLSSKLGDLLGYKVFLEPTATNPYLSLFYKEPSKYALIMQKWLLNQRYNTFLNALQYSLENEQGVILDRSVYSDWVFAENCRSEGLISAEGFKEYNSIRDRFLSNIPIPNVTLFLDVDPKQCLQRIQNRKRDCEQSIPLSYLSGLDNCYKKFLIEMKSKGSNVIILDWNNFGDINLVLNEINNDNFNNFNNSNNSKFNDVNYKKQQLISDIENEKNNLKEMKFFLNENNNNNNQEKIKS